MKINSLIITLAFFLLILSLFLSIIDYCCFDKSFYNEQYDINQTAKDIKVSDEALDHMTDILLDYLKDKRDDIILYEDVDGINREIFNDREKMHMVDVKELYQHVITFRNMVLLMAIIILIYYLIYDKKYLLTHLFSSYFKALSILLAVIVAIAISAILDFDTFWTSFHQLFFDNDLWLLNPYTDLMILMVPSSFFNALAMRIILLSIILSVLLAFLFKKLNRGVI